MGGIKAAFTAFTAFTRGEMSDLISLIHDAREVAISRCSTGRRADNDSQSLPVLAIVPDKDTWIDGAAGGGWLIIPSEGAILDRAAITLIFEAGLLQKRGSWAV